jgi:hypothetical protein
MPRAITKGHKRIGSMPCICCGKEVPVKKTSGGKLSIVCDWCDLPLYINVDTEAFDRFMAKVVQDPVPEASPAPETQATKAATVAPAAVPPAPREPEKKPESPKPPARSFASPLFGTR